VEGRAKGGHDEAGMVSAALSRHLKMKQNVDKEGTRWMILLS
jgi:hypothetical protein